MLSKRMFWCFSSMDGIWELLAEVSTIEEQGTAVSQKIIGFSRTKPNWGPPIQEKTMEIPRNRDTVHSNPSKFGLRIPHELDRKGFDSYGWNMIGRIKELHHSFNEERRRYVIGA